MDQHHRVLQQRVHALAARPRLARAASASNGFETNATSAPKNTTFSIITATTHGMSARLRRAVLHDHEEAHQRRASTSRAGASPACPPHSAALNIHGCSRVEICATNARSKRSPSSAASSPSIASVSSANTRDHPRSALVASAGLLRRPASTPTTPRTPRSTRRDGATGPRARRAASRACERAQVLGPGGFASYFDGHFAITRSARKVPDVEVALDHDLGSVLEQVGNVDAEIAHRQRLRAVACSDWSATWKSTWPASRSLAIEPATTKPCTRAGRFATSARGALDERADVRVVAERAVAGGAERQHQRESRADRERCERDLHALAHAYPRAAMGCEATFGLPERQLCDR